MHRRIPAILALGLVCTGCDAQFSPKYLGESLLTVTGSVEIANNQTKGRLVPALAFENQNEGTLDIVDVAVEGEFPSDFRLDVYDRPPEAAFLEAGHQSGEPRLAVGYITAVSVDHPSSIRFATGQSTTAAASCAGPTCEPACESGECEVLHNEWCTKEGSECYVEITICPTSVPTSPDCRVESKGDPSLKAEPWRYFAGFSENYLVVYLEQAARKGSWTALLLGSPDGLPAGYGLYAIRGPSQAEQDAERACIGEVNASAARMYNRDHGTDFASIELDACISCADGVPDGPGVPGVPEESSCDAPPPPDFCQGTSEELDRFLLEHDRYHERSRIELGCAPMEQVLSRVEAPERESVSVRIGAEPRH